MAVLRVPWDWRSRLMHDWKWPFDKCQSLTTTPRSLWVNSIAAAGNPDVVSVRRKNIIAKKCWAGQGDGSVDGGASHWSNHVSTSPGTYLGEAENWDPQIVSWPQYACCDTHVHVHACACTHTYINKYDPLSCLHSKMAKRRANSCAKKGHGHTLPINHANCTLCVSTSKAIEMFLILDILEASVPRTFLKKVPSVVLSFTSSITLCALPFIARRSGIDPKKPGKPQTSTWLRPACVAGSTPPKPV